MATSDYYYNSPTSPKERNRRSIPDLNAPLPAIPTTVSVKSKFHQEPSVSISPVTPPFSDREYASYHASQRSLSNVSAYHGRSERSYQQPDPFSDNAAIPLQAQYPKSDERQDSGHYDPEYEAQYPPTKPPGGVGRKRGKKGWFGGRIPWVVYTLTLVQITVFIVEIVKNSVLTKSPIQIKPQFNPMIGPSTYVLINMGARYVPCMRNTPNIQNSSSTILWPCPNTTDSNPTCSLSDLCGFSGVPNPRPGGSLDDSPAPNQWFRFIIPIFLHAGILHISFNMLLQLTLGKDMERTIGALRFALVYFSSGIFGFVLGGNYAASGVASTGASGCLFGILALVLLDLLYNWRERTSPVKEILFFIMVIVIALVLGLLPGLDNFSHIGGFLMGLALGICILHSPTVLRQRITEPDTPPYVTVGEATTAGENEETGLKGFAKQPVGFFKGRKPLWWLWWFVRAGALVGVLVGFVLLLNNFYKYHANCGWCKYLSCLPVKDWCDIGNLRFTNTTSNPRRDLFSMELQVIPDL